jgi:hypothetical protein
MFLVVLQVTAGVGSREEEDVPDPPVLLPSSAATRGATRRHCSSTVPAVPEGIPTLLWIFWGFIL